MVARNFEQRFIKKNTGKLFKPFGTVNHETADPGATAEDEAHFFDGWSKTSVHSFVDWIRDIQIVPWNIKCEHVGPKANSKFIGVEMCRPATHDPEKMKIVYWAAVDAHARIHRWILNNRIITPDNCLSHDEVRIKYGGTSHTDPTALFKEYGYTMDQFRRDVQYRLNMKWEG